MELTAHDLFLCGILGGITAAAMFGVVEIAARYFRRWFRRAPADRLIVEVSTVGVDKAVAELERARAEIEKTAESADCLAGSLERQANLSEEAMRKEALKMPTPAEQ